ncbi:MAG: hypothetical protein IJW78_02090 [Clostridia bacterium]|nr:hypothetical protein [Clostridia bacterium]
MFGFVRAYKPQLRFCEYDVYKAVYCTLCRRQGELYGPLARLALSYDVQFLALLCVSLSKHFNGLETKKCKANPLKKCMYCKAEQNAVFDYPSAVAMILTYYKFLDNIADEKGIRRLVYRLGHILMKKNHKKAANSYPMLEEICQNYYNEQSALEKASSASLDLAAEPTAKALASIFAACDKKQAETLSAFGYNLGKWIYLLDAGADLKKDLKDGGFNPLQGYCADMPIAEVYEKVLEPNLNVCSAVCAEQLENLQLHRFRPIIENVVYLGLENAYKHIKMEDMNEKSV